MMSSSIVVTTPASSYDLTVLDTVKAEFGITDSSEDENLQRWIRQASGTVARYCGRVFALESVTETFYYDFYPDDILLNRFPNVVVSSVDENGTVLGTSDYSVDADSGQLYRLSGDSKICWSPGKIIVSYSGGYTLLTNLPFELERACIVLVNQYRQSATRDPGLRSESVSDVGSASYFNGEYGGTAPEVRGLLCGFRRGLVW